MVIPHAPYSPSNVWDMGRRNVVVAAASRGRSEGRTAPATINWPDTRWDDEGPRYHARLVRQIITVITLVGSLAGAWACGRTPAAPTFQPPIAPPQPLPAPANVVISGRVASSVTGQPLTGVTVSFDGQETTSGAGGDFRYELPSGAAPGFSTVRLSGPAILERVLGVRFPASRESVLDAIDLGSGFDLEYYRRLVRDSRDNGGVLRALRRWNRAPKLYIRTIDELGQPIEAITLNTVANALQDDPSAWTGGRFGLSDVVLGTDSREGVSGWITVKWVAPLSDESICGRAQVAADGGWIEFNYLNQTGCDCRGSRIGAMTARHELGHALGFFHTGADNDVMWSSAVCDDRRPSARERLHAAIAYGRTNGNLDPDIDPGTTLQSIGPPLIVVD